MTKKQLLSDNEFREDFQCQKERIRKMQIRVVHIDDPPTQAMFEVYAAVALNTRYNEFENS